MVKGATNTSVAELEVEVDRPGDRERKRDNVRSNPGQGSVSGSGATGTLKTNNSSGEWYLEQVTGYALGATSGVLAVKIQVTNAAGSVKSELGGDLAGGVSLEFGGVQVKEGWSIDYVIEQNDANSYTVELMPLIRKPEPDERRTVEPTTIIDSFEDGSISEYTGDTANYSVVSTDSYHLDNSLEYSDLSNSRMWSTSGLNVYPAKGDTVTWRAKSSSIDSSDDPNGGIMFGVVDDRDHYEARVNWDDRKLVIIESWSDGGLTHRSVVAESSYGSGFATDRWDKCELDWGDTITFSMTNSDDNSTMASLSMSFNDFEKSRSSGGFGWRGSVENGETIRFDKAEIDG